MAGKSGGSGALGMIVFLLLFLVPAGLTYFSGLLLGAAAIGEETAGDAGAIRNTFLGFCYAVMIVACWIRGRAVERTWLVALPIVAAVFDIFLAFIPFVPTLLNIAVLATGIPPARQTATE